MSLLFTDGVCVCQGRPTLQIREVGSKQIRCVLFYILFLSNRNEKKKTVAGVAQRVVHYEHDNSGYCYSVYDISESLNRRN